MDRSATRLLLAALPLALAATDASAAACDDIEFSAEVLSNYPKAREACQGIITVGGIDYMQLRGEVRRTSHAGSEEPLRVYVQGLNETIEASPPAEMNYQITGVERGGRKPRVNRNELRRGDRITILIAIAELEEDDVIDEVAFGEEPAEIVVVQAVEVAAVEPAALPKTASPWPAVGLVGALCVAAGALLGVGRRLV